MEAILKVYVLYNVGSYFIVHCHAKYSLMLQYTAVHVFHISALDINVRQ